MNPLPIDTIAPAVLGPESAGMLLTPEEFDAVTDYDDQFRYELIRGVLVVTPIPAEAEACAERRVGRDIEEISARKSSRWGHR